MTKILLLYLKEKDNVFTTVYMTPDSLCMTKTSVLTLM